MISLKSTLIKPVDFNRLKHSRLPNKPIYFIMTTTRKSARKKQNRFDELGEAIAGKKDSVFVDPSSITGDNDSKDTNLDSTLKESFLNFQKKTNARFANMDYNFRQMADTLTSITESLARIHSRQDELFHHQMNHDDQINSPSFTKSNHTDVLEDDHHPSNSTPYGSPPI